MKIWFRQIRLSLVTVALLLLPNIAFAGPNKQVKDWQVYCENDLFCTLSFYSEDMNIGSFGFERGPQANAPVTLFVSVGSTINEESDIVITIPDQLPEFSLSVSSGQFKDGIWRFTGDGIEDHLLAAMSKGKTMEMHLETAEGFLKAPISLSGVTASLLFVDDVQQRIGNRDALIRKGSGAPANATTRATNLKNSGELPAPVLSLWQNNAHFCTMEDQDVIESFGGFRVDLERETALYVLPCGSPGAYNLPSIAFGYSNTDKRAKLAAFPVMGWNGPGIMDLAINVNWDDRRSTLSANAKLRGLGDCGISHVWKFIGDGLSGNFELLEQRSKEDCDGVYDEWPLVWPIK